MSIVPDSPAFPPQDSWSILFIAIAAIILFGIIFLKWYRDEYLPAEKKHEEKNGEKPNQQ